MLKQTYDPDKKMSGVENEKPVRCPACNGAPGTHLFTCKVAPDEWKAENYNRVVEHYEKRIDQMDGYRKQVESYCKKWRSMVSSWHAKYMVVKHENNKLRKKVSKQYRREKWGNVKIWDLIHGIIAESEKYAYFADGSAEQTVARLCREQLLIVLSVELEKLQCQT